MMMMMMMMMMNLSSKLATSGDPAF